MKVARRFAVGLIAAAAFGSAVSAQAPARRVRGTIESIDGSLMVVRTSDAAVPVTLAPDVSIGGMVKGALSDITPGSFVGVVGLGPNDRMKAVNIAIFPEAARGTGEGHFAWDSQPDSTMTNAAIDGSVASADGRTLTLTAKGEHYTALVTPDTVIVKNEPGTTALLKPGAWVFLSVRPNDSGMLTTSRVNVGVDGFAPPL